MHAGVAHVTHHTRESITAHARVRERVQCTRVSLTSHTTRESRSPRTRESARSFHHHSLHPRLDHTTELASLSDGDPPLFPAALLPPFMRASFLGASLGTAVYPPGPFLLPPDVPAEPPFAAGPGGVLPALAAPREAGVPELVSLSPEEPPLFALACGEGWGKRQE